MNRIFALCVMFFCFLWLSGCADNEILIQFETNGGSEINDILFQEIGLDGLPIPTKSGFVFMGWYLDEELTIAMGREFNPTQSVKLYAKWEVAIVNYTITFDSNGGTSVNALILAAGGTIVLPENPTKDGHMFIGWFADSALSVPFILTVMPDQNLILYAKWDTVVTVTFDTQGGSVLLPIAGKSGEAMTIGTPIRQGYVFSGWYPGIEDTELYDAQNFPDQSMTLYADWSSEGLLFSLINSNEAYEVLWDESTEIIHLLIPKHHLGKPVIRLAEQGFRDSTSTLTARLSPNIRSIGNHAFLAANSLQHLYLPVHLEIIGISVFKHCYALESIYLSELNPSFSVVDGVLYSKNLETLIRYPQAKSGTSFQVPNHVRTIGEDAFSSNHLLTSLDLGSGVSVIRDHAFYDMIALSSIVIPNQVTTMELYAFRDCYALASVTLGSGLTSIEAYVFNYAVSLKTLIVPYGITFIGYGAFYNSGLENLYITRTSLNGVITGSLFMFAGTSSYLKIYLPDVATMNDYKTATYWKGYATKMEVGQPS